MIAYLILPCCICGPTLATNCREANSKGCLLTNLKSSWLEITHVLVSHLAENGGLGVFGDIMSDLKVTKSTSALGMDNPRWDPLSIEVGHLLEEDMVLDEEGSAGADGHRVELVSDRSSMACGQRNHLLESIVTKEITQSVTCLVLLLVVPHLVGCLVPTTHLGLVWKFRGLSKDWDSPTVGS